MYNPSIEATKDTVFQALARSEVQLWIEHEDIRSHMERERNSDTANDCDLIRLMDLCNDAYTLYCRAANAASARFNIAYIIAGGE